MFIRDLFQCEEFIAGDDSILREILHPDKAGIKLGYSLAHAIVKPGQVTLPHRLSASEVYYIMEGEGIMYIGEEEAVVGPGQTIYIPPHHRQCIRNTGKQDLKFLCIVDPAWRKTYEEIIEK